MIIVFLDIDGPITNLRVSTAGMRYDPVNVSIINKLFAQDDVRVVLASCERIICKDAGKAYERLKKRYDLECKFHEFWRTYKNLGCGDEKRGAEIIEWIDKHHVDGNTYVSIDDDIIDVEGVISIKANLNGLSYLQMLRIQSLYKLEKLQDYERQLEWENSQPKTCF